MELNSQVAEREGIEILRVLCGSRAYGLHDDDSDFDYHGVFVVPTHRFFTVATETVKIKETRWIEGSKEDDVAWEIGHFLRLAVRCNPTVLETFVAPVVPLEGTGGGGLVAMQAAGSTGWGQQLRDLFPAVVSRKQIFESFMGYAHNQRKKMFDPTGGVRASEKQDKFALNYLRVLYQGRHLLETGKLVLEVSHAHFRDFLLRIKAGNYKLGEAVDTAQSGEKLLSMAYAESAMREEPDLDAVNALLYAIRKEFW